MKSPPSKLRVSESALDMKILYPIIDGEITGGNIICLELIEGALRQGWEVIVNSSTDGNFVKILRRKGVKVYHIDTGRSFRLGSAMKLARIVRKENVNLVHSHAPLAGIVLSRLAGALTGTPVITHAHIRMPLSSNPLIRNYQLLLNWISSRFFCHKVIAVSETVKREFVEQGTPENKIAVVYNGINLDHSQSGKGAEEVRKEFDLTTEQKIIGQVGRLCRTKGQHNLIRAAAVVIERFRDTVFIIVGEDLEEKGRYREKLENLTEELGIKNHIIFTGYRSDILDLMNAFDIFALPSSAEGLPVVILEAMAARKPVIATPVGGNREVVIDGKTGTIVPPENPNSLAEAIIYHLENPEVSQEMGRRGYERVKEHFTRDEMVKRTFQVYEEVLRHSLMNVRHRGESRKAKFIGDLSSQVARLAPRWLILAIYRVPRLTPSLRILANLCLPLKERIVAILGGLSKGLKMDLNLQTEKAYWLGTYETRVQALLREVIKPHSVVYDIGAHIGFFSLITANLTGSQGRVFAFEPSSENLQRLRRNIGLNKMTWIYPVPVAVCSQTGTGQFECASNHSSMGRLQIPKQDYQKSCFAPTITLDNFVFQHNYSPPDVIKVDIEGGEGRAMAGARKVLAKFKPVIICELHGHKSSQQAWGVLQRANYEIYDLRGRRLMNMPNYGHVMALKG